MKPHSGNKYKVIGTMSGTSLDGLDIVAVEFTETNGKWEFSIVAAETVKYSDYWEKQLENAPSLAGDALMKLHANFGRLCGKEIQAFIHRNNFHPFLIASHGHTIFHQPENGFTFQAGDGHSIAIETKTMTVADFRSSDVASGGQGAPLVPVGDKFLFHEYDYCLNLGGFSNISYDKNGKRVAFDICPTNIILNDFAKKHGHLFDKNGEMGQKGEIHKPLLAELNALRYYKQYPPKSLGREWLEEEFIPVLEKYRIPDFDKMRTLYEHIALQISSSVTDTGKLLVTGGGAHNKFLIERIKNLTETEVIIPEDKITDYKEALIFAFLGVLRLKSEINCFASVTGAQKDSSAGVIFMP